MPALRSTLKQQAESAELLPNWALFAVATFAKRAGLYWEAEPFAQAMERLTGEDFEAGKDTNEIGLRHAGGLWGLDCPGGDGCLRRERTPCTGKIPDTAHNARKTPDNTSSARNTQIPSKTLGMQQSGGITQSIL